MSLVKSSERFTGLKNGIIAPYPLATLAISSSSVYGDDNNLPKIENRTGQVLSPYAATKSINEIYANNLYEVYMHNSRIKKGTINEDVAVAKSDRAKQKMYEAKNKILRKL